MTATAIGLYASGWPEHIRAHPSIVAGVLVLGVLLITIGFVWPREKSRSAEPSSIPAINVQVNPVFNNSPDPANPKHYVTVLHVPPVVSPQTAVRAAIVQEFRTLEPKKEN